jgi:hypothetical protein
MALGGVFLQATPVLPWLREHVLGREPAGAAALRVHGRGDLHGDRHVHTYVHGHRGTKRVRGQAGMFAVLTIGYLAIMGTKVTTPSGSTRGCTSASGCNVVWCWCSGCSRCRRCTAAGALSG